MKQYAAVTFLIILMGLMVSGGCSCGGGDDDDTIYIPPTNTGTGTTSTTNTSTNTDTSQVGPTIVSATWNDADSNGIASAFDDITVVFSEAVTGTTTIADFSLPVTGDDFGSAAVANIITGNVEIILGTGPVLTIPGVFDALVTAAGSPSGLTVNGGTAITGQTSGQPVQAGTVDISGATGINPKVISANLVTTQRIDVKFDVEVEVNTSVSNDPTTSFELPVSGDNFGTAPTMEASSLDTTVIIIHMDSDNKITEPGIYDPLNENPDDPSGIDIQTGQIAVVSSADYLAAIPSAEAVDIGLDNNPPALIGAYYSDVDADGEKNAGDQIILYFDREVQLVGAAATMPAVFSGVQDDGTSLWLPVTNDSLDSVDNVVTASDTTAGDNEIEITLGDNPVLLVAGLYNPDYTVEGAPSGIGFGNSGLIESIMSSEVALMDNAVDIEPGDLPAGFVEIAEGQYGGDDGTYWQAVCSLDDGRPFTAGGCFTIDPSIYLMRWCTIFDPVTETWKNDISMSGNDGSDPFNHAVMGAACTLLQDGNVFICGGWGIVDNAGASGGTSNYMFVYNPTADTMTQLPNRLSIPRFWHSVTTLGSGDVLIFGGYGNESGDMYGQVSYSGTWVTVDPSDGSEVLSGTKTGGVIFGALHNLAGKPVYIGGRDVSAAFSNVVQEFNGSDWVASTPGDIGNANWMFGSAKLSDTSIFTHGSRITGDPVFEWGSKHAIVWNDGGSIDQSTNMFIAYANISTRYTLSAGKLGTTGDALISGGCLDIIMYVFGELYDVSTNEVWDTGFPQVYPRRLHRTAELSDGGLLIIGGASNMGIDNENYIDFLGVYDGYNNQNLNTGHAERFHMK
ncbi:MAG: Kelch repeat-containing protein [Planctomycetota bacterium]|jgi:hypothetical protein